MTVAVTVAAGSTRPPAVRRGLLRQRAFTVLYAAEVQSIAGDQLTRVALSVLVFARTGSAAATALTYAVTVLPAIFGGFLLGGLGDRLPRKMVLIGCDLTRAVLVAFMALPGVPLGALFPPLIVSVALGPLFAAAKVSVLAASLPAEQLRTATGLRMLSTQAAQVLGFGTGGALVAALQPRGALALDALTFAVSAVLVTVGLPTAGSTAQRHSAGSSADISTAVAARWSTRDLLWRQRRVRALLSLSVLAGLFVVPEGLAVPFGHEVGAGTAQIGYLLAAIPLGSVVGAAWLMSRSTQDARGRRAQWMAVLCGAALVATGFVSSWHVAAAFWLVSGFFGAYQIEIMTAVVRVLPDASRSRALAAASSTLLAAQGLGIAAFGVVARIWNSGAAVSVAGGLGAALAAHAIHALRRRPRPGRSR